MLYNCDMQGQKAFKCEQLEWADTECQDAEPEWKRQRSRAGVLSKQKTQPDGDEEPCQYGLCCDACRAEGKGTPLLKDGGRNRPGEVELDHRLISRFWERNLPLMNQTLRQTASLF